MSSLALPQSLGRYAVAERIAAGGMASIYLARQVGAAGFSRLVAIKRLHEHIANQPEFSTMFLDEARLAARVRHPNVVETVDVVRDERETFIVLEYVDGESLAALCAALREAGQLMPSPIAVAIVSAICRGLHAAHEARGADGVPLGIVHRDVSPQNVLVGADGIPRVADFGVALASGRLSQTRAGQVKGKLAYMAPEQLSRGEATRASDIYAAGVILWELFAGRRAHDTSNEGALIGRVMAGSVQSLHEVAPWVSGPLLAVVDRALRREPAQRFASAQEMANALESASRLAAPSEVASFVETFAAEALAARRAVAAKLDLGAAPPPPPSGAGLSESGVVSNIALGQLPPAPPSLRPPFVEEPTGSRRSQTLTSPARFSGRSRSGTGVLVALALALLGACAMGVAATWFALRGPRSARISGEAREVAAVPFPAPAPATPDVTRVLASTPVDAVATSEHVDPEPLPSSATSSSSTDRIQLPHRPGSATAVPTKRCDPPYYIDASGIRRVKRECF